MLKMKLAYHFKTTFRIILNILKSKVFIFFGLFLIAYQNDTTYFAVVSLKSFHVILSLTHTAALFARHFVTLQESDYFHPRGLRIFKIFAMFFDMRVVKLKFFQYCFKLHVSKIPAQLWNDTRQTVFYFRNFRFIIISICDIQQERFVPRPADSGF